MPIVAGAPLVDATCFDGAYELRVPRGWLTPAEVRATGLDPGPFVEQFVSRRAYDGPSFSTIFVRRRPRFPSMAASGGRDGAARLMAYLEDQELANNATFGPVAAYDTSQFERAWVVDYASVGRLEGLTSTTTALLVEAPEEDVFLMLNNGEKEAVDFKAVAASLRHVPRRVCAACGGSSSKLSQCAACKTVLYCSRACQASHWKLGHKAVCRAAVAARAGV